MEYILPSKNLLEKERKNLDNDKYYTLYEIIDHKDFEEKFACVLGKKDDGEYYYLKLSNVSGVFISGETGSGKSMLLHAIILSLLMENGPDDMKFIFYDKRKVELNSYITIPHLFDILYDFNDMKDIITLLDYRKDLFISKRVTNIEEYNKEANKRLPRIVIVIDEVGDLLNKDVFKNSLIQILSEGYKYGIHLIMATSSYLKDYYDNKILDLFSYVLTFDLASHEQAKFIKIDDTHLLNAHGDAKIKCRTDDVVDLQTPYVYASDIENVVNFINNNYTK
ncbi:MAG: AAA family ATPase [Bacilli bacterium]|nr:AAA family ATPase [Bacilli bacterium]